MMQSCSVCHVVGGSCSCGWFHNQTNSFSMLFSGGPNTNTQNYFDTSNQPDMYSSYYSAPPLPPPPPSSSVDCTLSLGTPSTRLSNQNNCDQKRRSSCVSKFCSWDFLKPTSHESSSPTSSQKNHNNRASNYNYSYSHYSGDGRGGDSLSSRRCANCDTTSTPLWRNGPKGPKSLCNACGIRYKKEERRASAAAAAAATNDNSPAFAGVVVDNYHIQNNSWVHHSQNQKLPNNYFSSAYAAGNEFRFMEEEDARDADGIPYLSWRFNVTDRAAHVHDFTR